jgi:hypothetical protein
MIAPTPSRLRIVGGRAKPGYDECAMAVPHIALLAPIGAWPGMTLGPAMAQRAPTMTKAGGHDGFSALRQPSLAERIANQLHSAVKAQLVHSAGLVGLDALHAEPQDQCDRLVAVANSGQP